MTDAELIREVAEEVMGWKIVDADPQYYGDVFFCPTTNLTWIAGYHVEYGPDEWNPITNANHWMMVVQKMSDKGWVAVMECWPTHWYVRFQRERPRAYFEKTGTVGRAVLLAAKAALEVE